MAHMFTVKPIVINHFLAQFADIFTEEQGRTETIRAGHERLSACTASQRQPERTRAGNLQTACSRRLFTASQGMLRYESATTQPPVVSVQLTTNSPQCWALIWPAAKMGTHTNSVNMPICNVESMAASRPYTPMSTAAPAARKV